MRGTLRGQTGTLGVLIVVALLWPSNVFAQGEPVKPYILFIADTSGSMNSNLATGDSCSGQTGRIDHLRCALQRIVDGNGDIDMGLGKFHQTTTDTNCSNGCSMATNCIGTNGEDPDNMDVVVPIVAENALDVREWANFSCGTCGTDQSMDPELYASGITPLAGSLYGAQRYFQGNDPIWSALPGGDPIRDDPLKNIFQAGAQCRPYITILLTDGSEFCGGDVPAAATDLLTTSVTGEPNPFRIRTIPIGFGMTCPNTNIENIAHAGGAPDVGGVCEGFYAANEDELAVAVSQIIADSLKFETCNDLDDDCDVLVDEDFPDKGAVCNDGLLGICLGTGTKQCTLDGSGTECVIDTPGQAVGVETCNGLDDDCDGKIDESPADCTGCQQGEICNNIDDDCDGLVDEDLTRTCGTNVGQCTSGTETCFEGNWINCDSTGPFLETCDNVDNDCDGVVDGFAQSCENAPTPPTGDPNEGICQPGTEVCVNGSFGSCLGEVDPQAQDLCDGEDNDCDGNIDEDHVPADCSSACGTGQTVCDAGVIVCQGTGVSEPEICDGVDNDCDMLIDEGQPDMGPCDEGGSLCVPGILKCVGGSYMCIGGSLPGTEICDCTDNNCNGEIDEGTVCGSGQACVNCECASPCSSGEFPCPIGQLCEGGFCLTDACFGVTCGTDMNGDHQSCEAGGCVRTCDTKVCPTGFLCRGDDGECHPDSCVGFPERCGADERCVAGTCEADPCFDVTCEANQFCVEGQCAGTCTGVECQAGERCVQGVCEIHPCGGDCPGGQFCDETDGQCKDSLCTNTPCPAGLACNPANGICEADPCFNVMCPNPGEVCTNGSCDTPPQPDADGGVDNSSFVSAAGGGGCTSCNSGSSGSGSSALLLLLVGYLALGRKKRRGLSNGEAA